MTEHQPPDPAPERHRKRRGITPPPWLTKAKATAQRAYAKAKERTQGKAGDTASAVAKAIASTPVALATLAAAVVALVGAGTLAADMTDLRDQVNGFRPVDVRQLERDVDDLAAGVGPLRSQVDNLRSQIDDAPNEDAWAGVAREVDAASAELASLSRRLERVTGYTADASRSAGATAGRVQDVAEKVEVLATRVEQTAEELSRVAQAVSDATGKAGEALKAAARAATAAASAQQVAQRAQQAVAGLTDTVDQLGEQVGSLEAGRSFSVESSTDNEGEGVIEWPTGLFAAPPVVSVTPSTQGSATNAPIHLCNVTGSTEVATRFRCWELQRAPSNQHLIAQPARDLQVHVTVGRTQ